MPKVGVICSKPNQVDQTTMLLAPWFFHTKFCPAHDAKLSVPAEATRDTKAKGRKDTTMKREDTKKAIKKAVPDIAEDVLNTLTDELMDQHSADVGKLKQDLATATTERDTLKTQLGEANEKIKSYTDMDVDGIKQSVKDWETKYNTDTQALKDQLANQSYGYAVERSVAGLKFSSGAAQKQFIADLKSKKLPLQEDKLLGMEDYVKQYKEADPDAFASEDDKTPVAVRGGSGAGPMTDAALRAAMGLPPDKK